MNVGETAEALRISNALVMRSTLFWRFGRNVASQLGFDFLDGGQTAAQFLWEGFGELGLPCGDGNGLVQAAQGIFGDEPVLFFDRVAGLW